MKAKWFIAALVMSAFACQEETKETVNLPAPPVPLTFAVDYNQKLFGESIDLNLSVDNDTVTGEEIALEVRARLSGKDVSQIFFEGFPEDNKLIILPKGTSEHKITAKINTELPEEYAKVKINTVEITAFVRGYKMSGQVMNDDGSAGQNVNISEHFYANIVMKGTETKIDETGNFSLIASLPVPATEDLVLKLDIDETTLEGHQFEGFPETLTIPQGETSVESGKITSIHDPFSFEDAEVLINLSSTNEEHPLMETTLTVGVNDIDQMGSLLDDERHVYTLPHQMFVSKNNKAAVDEWLGEEANYVEMTKGMPHPNPALTDWKFALATEFHNIPFLYFAKPNDIRSVKGYAAQNTSLVQKHMAVNIDKYSHIMDDGHLRMWAMAIQENATGGAWGPRNWATAAFAANKYTAGNNDKKFATQHMRIHPGTRIEARLRVRGEKKGFNMAFWLQGNANATLTWPEYGEIDILENPAPSKEDMTAHSTFHMGVQSEDNSTYKNPTVSNQMAEMDDWDIYWVELVDANTVRIGINGQTVNEITKSQFPDLEWPFNNEVNPYGFHVILTMGAPSAWALGTAFENDLPPLGWDDGFSQYTNYLEDRFKPELPHMEIDWIRYYTNANYDVPAHVEAGGVFSSPLY